MRYATVRHATACGLALWCCAMRAGAQQAGRASASLDSLLGLHITAASKYAQTAAEAPASVTLLTADDIRQFGFRNLQEALESVRGFYISNDHNYPYLGTRGFSRPTDYNNRILLLVDGHALNDQTWGSAPVGSDLPINLDAVERIEIVRGPGSALYGTSAMFAVINIVTKTGAQLDGAEASVRAGSNRSLDGGFAAGHAWGERASLAASGIATYTGGSTLRFPELNTPETNFGVSRGMDWERSLGGTASATFDEVSARVGYRSRAKGIPTGAFAVSLTDPRAETVDETLWGELSATHEIGATFTLAGRVYGDRYRYRGVYPSGPGPTYTDGGGSTDAGAEGTLTWDPASRDRLILGAEYRRVPRANYYEQQADGSVTRDDAPFSITSVFAENAWHVTTHAELVTGVRYDYRSSDRHATAPRAALVVTLDPRTTIKLLYGEAYRAPSAAEADLSTTFYTRNPALKPERIRTFEFTAERRVTARLFVLTSIYHYLMQDLIDQVQIDSAGALQFRNVAKAKATGIEAEANYRTVGPLSAQATYALQRAEYEPGNRRMTNSPEQIATLSATAQSTSGAHAAITTRYESGRLTLAGTSTRAFTRTDANIGYSPQAAGVPRWMHSIDVSLRVTNVFDTQYAVPAGIEHLQTTLPQAGRALSLRFDWRF